MIFLDMSSRIQQKKKSVDYIELKSVYIAKKEKNTEWQKILQLYIG